MRKLSACGWHQCSESGSDLLRPIDGGQWTEPGSLSHHKQKLPDGSLLNLGGWEFMLSFSVFVYQFEVSH